MPHPRDFEHHALPREPYAQSAPTQKPVPPLIRVRLVWRDAFDIKIASIGRVLLGGSKYMYLRLLPPIARCPFDLGAERSGAEAERGVEGRHCHGKTQRDNNDTAPTYAYLT